MDQEISLSRVKLYLHNISLWNSAKNYSNFFLKLSTAVNPEEYFNTYQTYFQLFPTVKSALHAVYVCLFIYHLCLHAVILMGQCGTTGWFVFHRVYNVRNR